MRLSWRLENIIEHNLVLGLSPSLAGVVGGEIEDFDDDELVYLWEWLNLRNCEFEGADRSNISAEMTRRNFTH